MRTKLTTLLLCLSAYYCFGQSDKDKGWDLPNGFRAGYQWSNLVKDGESAADNLDGFYAGYVRKFRLLHLLKVETGLEYMMAGAKQTEDTKLQLHYLVVPAEAAIKLGPFVGMAGLSANFKVGEKYTENGQEVDRLDKANSFDTAANVGAGFNFFILMLEARYYWGLTDVQDGWKNQYWQLGLKLHF